MKCIVVIFLLLVFVEKIYESNGLCNTCSAITGLACVSKTSFKICENGALNQTATAVQCPSGTFCTPNAYVCDKSPTGLPSACAKCGECLDGSNFACIGYNTFAYCLEDGKADLSMNYTCPSNLVCNSGLTPICTNPSLTGIGSQCPWEEPTTTTTTTTTNTLPTEATTIPTTPDPLTNANLFCSNLAKAGRYEVSLDTTCQLFVSCFSSGGVWTGNLYECPQGAYFNGTSQRCGAQKPARCP